MFSYIIGKVAFKQENLVVVENNGIGYEILVSLNTASECKINEEIKVYTYMQVKEDGIALFGFSDLEEKNLFLNLISVSGVGPKGAISILSNIGPTDLSVAINRQDITAISSVKGIGKKTAERIVVELKDKVSVVDVPNTDYVVVDSKAVDEACLALVSLGMNKQDALMYARQFATENSTAEEIISKCLRQMGN